MNLARTRQDLMVLSIWPWGYWVIGLVAIICGVALVVTARRLGIMNKTLGFVSVIMMIAGLISFLVGPIEMVEGDRIKKVFHFRKIAITGSKTVTLKWKQIKNVDIAMVGKLDAYNNTIHYRIEFTTSSNNHIRCLETTSRKKAKERVGSM